MTTDRLGGDGVLGTRSARVREARRLTRRSSRERSGRFLAEGPQAVREALGRTDLLVELLATREAAARHGDLLAAASVAGADVLTLTDEAMASLTGTVTPQGLVAVCRTLSVPLEAALAGPPRLVAVLDEAQDPGNAGTVIRVADAAGAGAVVLTEGSVDPHNGKAVRASAGSVFHLPVCTGPGLDEVVRACRGAGLAVIAADGRADLDLDQAERAGLLSVPTAWVFGNEARGLPPEHRALADHVLRVPLYGRAESLNLATAAAVCLYASARLHRLQASS